MWILREVLDSERRQKNMYTISDGSPPHGSDSDSSDRILRRIKDNDLMTQRRSARRVSTEKFLFSLYVKIARLPLQRSCYRAEWEVQLDSAISAWAVQCDFVFILTSVALFSLPQRHAPTFAIPETLL